MLTPVRKAKKKKKKFLLQNKLSTSSPDVCKIRVVHGWNMNFIIVNIHYTHK